MIRSAQDERERVVVEIRESSLAVVRLNRPAERNALSIQMLEALNKVFDELIQQADITAIIFTGTQDAFASGANIRELACLTPATAKEFAMRGQRLFQKIADAPQLTIAAINGYCMGGGLDLALACDLRCAARDAVFAHPGARLGIITGWGGTQCLPRLVGAARALEIFTTAKRFTAGEALSIGLVSGVGDPVLACAVKFAQTHEQRLQAHRTQDD